jgi:acyl dehydratase
MRPSVGDTARRSRVVRQRDIELFTELTGDRNPLHYGETAITAEVEILEAREDKPLTKLRTTIANQGGTVVLDGTALVWTEPL